MNDNNKKNQDNGLRIPERKTQNSLLEGQNRAAIDFRRQKVEQIYKKVNTEQQAEIQNQQENQTPAKINLADYLKSQKNTENIEKQREDLIKKSISEVSQPLQSKPKADFNSGVGQETVDFKSRQKIIQPLQNKQDIIKTNSFEKTAYKPQQSVQNTYQNSQKQQMSEQWKRYHAAWQNYYQKYYANYYSAALEQQKKKIANIQPEVI